jgi:hypothetical protein
MFLAEELNSRIEIGTVQDIGCRLNGIGAGDILIANFRNIARVPPEIGQVGGNSIYMPSLIEVVRVDSGAKGKIQSNFASHVITLLTPRRKRNSEDPSQLGYGLNTEVKNASSLFGVMRDIDDFGIHTIVAVSKRNCCLRPFHSPDQRSVSPKADTPIKHVTDVELWFTIADNHSKVVQIPLDLCRRGHSD